MTATIEYVLPYFAVLVIGFAFGWVTRHVSRSARNKEKTK